MIMLVGMLNTKRMRVSVAAVVIPSIWPACFKVRDEPPLRPETSTRKMESALVGVFKLALSRLLS